MFQISSNLKINVEILDNSKIYTIDNFYINPDSVVDYILDSFPELHKSDDRETYNGVYFEDRRHEIESLEIKPVYKFLESLCNQKPISDDLIVTNLFRMKQLKFNDFENNYWWPHTDSGYTGIIYLNENDNHSGTNLYEVINLPENYSGIPEHYMPWRSKKDFNIIKTITPKYNRLVFFDGKKFYHGMNICNKIYSDKIYRFNQAFFFKEN